MNNSGIHWNEPSTWPWIVYVWALLALAGYIKPAWRWLQRYRAADWPIADGRIESTEIVKRSFFTNSRRGGYLAVLHYSYFDSGGQHSGLYRRELMSEEEAEKFLQGLEGRPITVRHSPSNAARSILLDSDLELTLQSRPVSETVYSPPETNIRPGPVSPSKIILMLLACVGLILSLWVHIGALFGRRVAPEGFFWGLHVGAIVIWLPAVLAARNRVGSLDRKDFWKIVLRGAPDWMRYMVYGFFCYAVANFFIFFFNAPIGSHRAATPVTVWRGFSGQWMVFYFAAFAILYAAAHDERRKEPLSRAF